MFMQLILNHFIINKDSSDSKIINNEFDDNNNSNNNFNNMKNKSKERTVTTKDI